MVELKLENFIDNQLRGFSVYNNQRSIPSLVDGLKPSQRKVLYGMLKKYPTEEVKVSVAAAGIQSITEYHHGSLEDVVKLMAQSFPGTNNYPLLEGIGQFGSRIQNTPAASRYVFVKLSQNYRQFFQKDDELILNFLEEEGTSIEPEYYLPILPMVLINGSTGIATGWASDIPSYDAGEVKRVILNILNGKPLGKALIPHYMGFKGTVIGNDDQIRTRGVFEIVGNTIRITELPIGVYSMDYRAVLNKLEERGIVRDYEDNSNEDSTEFIVKVPRATAKDGSDAILKTFKLEAAVTRNLTGWDDAGKLITFRSPEDLIRWFVDFRLKKFEELRQKLINTKSIELAELAEEKRFILHYIDHASEWKGKLTAEIEGDLKRQSFTNISKLMSIRISRLTMEQISGLNQSIDSLVKGIAVLKSATAESIWKESLAKI